MDIRPLNGADAAAWAALVATCFARQPAEALKLWHWLQQGGQLVAWGAWAEQQLVAQYSCLKTHVTVRSEALPVGLSLSMAVHPAYRGRGLVKQVAAPVYQMLTAEECVAGVGFSNAAGVVVDRKSQGYGYQVVGQLLSVLTLLAFPRGAATLDLTTEFPVGALPSVRPSNVLSLARTLPWVQRRFAAHPFRQYHFGLWQTNAQLQGMVVYRPVRVWGVAGVALLAAYGLDLQTLLQRWVNTLLPLGVRFIHTLLTPAAPLWAALRAQPLTCLWPFSRAPHYLTVKPLQPAYAPLLLDYARWDCVGGEIL